MIDYLYKSLGLKCKLANWEKPGSLPMFLIKGIEYYTLSIEGTECLLMKIDILEFKISDLLNNVVQLAKYTDKPIALWIDKITSYQRKALIKNHTPFVVPGSQLYLPFLAINLKEYLPAEQKKAESLSAMGQMILLHIIYTKRNSIFYQKQITDELSVSAMNASRAVKELESLNLIRVSAEGKNKTIKPVLEGRELYEAGKKYMQSPIQKVVHVKPNVKYTDFPEAGETALSSKTMLNPPKHKCLALDRKNKGIIDSETIIDIDLLMPGEEYVEMQLWKYEPKAFADEDGVDVISLALSFKECIDERVEEAVEGMLEEYKW